MSEGVKFALYCVGVFLAGFGLAVLFIVLGLPSWAAALLAGILLFGVLVAFRSRRTGDFAYKVRRYGTEHDGKDVVLEFDERLVVLNRLRLHVDGRKIDETSIFYGTKRLDLGDSTQVEVGAGFLGECTGASLRTPSGSTEHLAPRP